MRWIAVPRALAELAVARIALRHMAAADISCLCASGGQAELSAAERRLSLRVGWAIPRVAALLPWRADCLVQALAARRWLERAGIPTSLELGATLDLASGLAAHAWLQAGGIVVTGGDASAYAPFRALDAGAINPALPAGRTPGDG